MCLSSIISLMDDDKEEGRKRGNRKRMRLVWTEISHGDGMQANQVLELINRSKYEKGTGRPIYVEDIPRLSRRPQWQLHTVVKCIWSLWKLGLIEEAYCGEHPYCGKDHVEGWVVTPSSRGSELPDSDTCWDVYKEACAWWYGHPVSPGSSK